MPEQKEIAGKTASGFEYSIKHNMLNNYELMEKIGEIDEDPFAVIDVVKMLLGKEQAKKLKDHVRLDDNTVPMDKMEAEIIEMFKAHPEVKNS